jgi:hypothetical protein
MTPAQFTSIKSHSLPLRLFTLLREPGEVATLLFAVAVALGGGRMGIKLFQGETNLSIGIAQGVFTVAAVFVVYFFRDRMKRTDKSAEIHKTDTSAQLDFVKIVQELTKQLQDSNSERLREQRDSYRTTIAVINNKHALELAAERNIKHGVIQILNSASLSATLIHDRIKHGICTLEEIYDEPRHLPAHLVKQVEALKVVPNPALEAESTPTNADAIHTTP